MQVFLAGVAGLLGVVLVIAGVKGNGANLFAGVTGTQVKSSTGLQDPGAVYTPPASGGGAVLPALGPTGPGTVGPVMTA